MDGPKQGVESLPAGRAPAAVALPHFPDVLHAVVWRNWDFVDVDHLAKVLCGTIEQIAEIAGAMGLPEQRRITRDERRRNYASILRRNWHLLPYEQLCELLEWDVGEMQYCLNEDDFMWVKLGGYKPRCSAVYYVAPDVETVARAKEIGRVLDREIGGAMHAPAEPLFGFIERFSHAPPSSSALPANSTFQVRMCYPYFLRFGDPLIGDGVDDVPEGYLAQLQSRGVNAIWFQGVLNKLAPWELDPDLSAGWEERIANLNRLVDRCGKFGIRVMMYLNEPRAMPRSFFESHPDLRGVEETAGRAPYSPNVLALCTSTPQVQAFLVNSVRHIFEQVPNLGGILAITFSENLTNCYSREYESTKPDEFALRSITNDGPKRQVNACPRCQARGAQTIHAEVNALLERGMRLAGSKGNYFWYVWSTPEDWIPGIIDRLSDSTWVLCISEWGKPFTRGDYTGKVNEYSISVIGPSEQSLRQWNLAKQRGLKTVAKLQAGTSFEMFLIPWLPASGRVARHLSNLADAKVDALMLGWSLGGWPSSNLAIATEMGKTPKPTVDEAMRSVAARCFGEDVAGKVVEAWNRLSNAFEQFPFDIATAYNAPQCLGPANLLYAEPTGLPATMITFPFDDLDGWRGPYSAETFQQQFEKLADEWQTGVDLLKNLCQSNPSPALEDEYRIAEAAGLCFRSTANQIRFVRLRESDRNACAQILRDEIQLARRMFDLVCQDSRIGFEATTQYAFTRFDLAEKILNCEHLLTQFP